MKAKSTFIIIFILFITFAAGGQGETEEIPGAFLLKNSFEFEPVPEGTKVLHEFVLKNTGSAPLQIQDVRTG